MGKLGIHGAGCRLGALGARGDGMSAGHGA
jgi:hypothetical protein